MDTKTCTKCRETKPLGEFYGRSASCKVCTCARVAAHRKANHAKVCAYDRERSKRPERKAKASSYQRAMTARNPERKKARTAVSNAVRDGRLRRKPCMYCGKLRVHGHHHDYSKPLEVEWVCFRCHRDREHGGHVEEVGGAREGPVRPEDVPPGQIALQF